MNNKKYQPIFGPLKRLGNFPMDPTDFFDSEESLKKYLSRKNSTAYVGQRIVVCGENAEPAYHIITKIPENKNAEEIKIEDYSLKLADTTVTAEISSSLSTTITNVQKTEESIKVIKREIGLPIDGEKPPESPEEKPISLLERISAVESSLETIKNNIGDETFSKLSEIQSSLTTLESNLANLKDSLDTHALQFDNILARSKLYIGLLSDVRTNASNINQIKNDIDKIESENQFIKDVLVSHSTDINKNKNNISAIDKTIETLATKTALDEKIDEVKKLINGNIVVDIKNVSHSIRFNFGNALENKVSNLPVNSIITSVKIYFKTAIGEENTASIILKNGETENVLISEEEISLIENGITYDFEIDNFDKSIVSQENNEILINSNNISNINGTILINYFI